MKKISFLVMAFAMIATSCQKYEEGPGVSLVSRTQRVANTWVINRATSDGQDVSDNFDQYEIYFTDDGDAELTAEYTFFGTTYIVDTQGTWEFANDKENLSVDFEDDDFDAEYQILLLKSDELWLRQIGEDLELELKEK